MNNFIKIIILIITSLFLGEILLRINTNYDYLKLRKRIKINDSEIFYENLKFNTNKIDSLKDNQNLNDFRIMILGDSRLLGFGLQKENRFKNKLKKYLNNKHSLY